MMLCNKYRLSFRLYSILLMVSLGAYAELTFANENNAPALVIVLDASNSMWGQVNGKTKIEIARTELNKLLAKPELSSQAQVMVYGSQSKSSCTDIKRLDESADSEALSKAINQIRPLGRSPIGAALKQAASNIQGQGSIVLISDGTESCDQDPCVITKELKQQQPGLKIYAVSLQTEKQNQTLTCIAESSGTDVLSANQLDSVVPQWLQATNSPSASSQSGDNHAPGTLQLSAGATDSQAKLAANFIIYSSQGEVIDSITAKTHVSKKLSPDEYEVSVLWGAIKQTAKLKLDAGQTLNHHFNLGALGNLNLKALDKAQQPVDANFTFYTANGDHIVDRLLKGKLQETLVQGSYKVKASFHGQTQEVLLTVKPETDVEHVFRFN
ncbi:MAG: VWA domain-containing protein [Candidatus Thiocaldithrix dubininis]|uniref:VWA domain-containing protein n=1 Tax=Candidatus Thiocaldithrix dubininis TaxID=3080823 RepID=A0AA95KEF9_9GAMM|nr:MAG: VWA domain-containing protein [Candidatus Thiocaldithrix dubininis]